MIPNEEELTRALSDEARFLREASAQSKIHNPKDPTTSIAALAAAMTLEGLSGAIGKVAQDPNTITIELRQQGVVWAAKSGERTALGATPLDAVQGVLDPSTLAFNPGG